MVIKHIIIDMYKIVRKKELNPTVTQMEIEAPLVAKKAKPGQFIILRVDAEGERIPLTVAGCNLEDGTVKIIFQIVGSTTAKLNHKQEGEYIEDFVGPLGRATEKKALRRSVLSVVAWVALSHCLSHRSSTAWALRSQA